MTINGLVPTVEYTINVVAISREGESTPVVQKATTGLWVFFYIFLNFLTFEISPGITCLLE